MYAKGANARKRIWVIVNNIFPDELFSAGDIIRNVDDSLGSNLNIGRYLARMRTDKLIVEVKNTSSSIQGTSYRIREDLKGLDYNKALVEKYAKRRGYLTLLPTSMSFSG